MAGSFNVSFQEQGQDFVVDYNKGQDFVVDYNDGISVVPWDKVTGKPFKTLGKGLTVVDGELQVSVVERIQDIATDYSLTEQAVLRDSGELVTYLEKFGVAHYSTNIGNGRSSYLIQHNLDSDALILQVWAMAGELPAYTASKIDTNTIEITFASPIVIGGVVLTVTKVEFATVDMIPWSNVSNVRYATREEMLNILEEN